jgi:hypothetical protein
MQSYLNTYSWFIYPNKVNKDLKLIITFSNNIRYDNIISHIMKHYNGELQNGLINNHNRIIVIKNIEILQFLSNIFKNPEKNNDLYKDYITIYYNQHLYFQDCIMI